MNSRFFVSVFGLALAVGCSKPRTVTPSPSPERPAAQRDPAPSPAERAKPEPQAASETAPAPSTEGRPPAPDRQGAPPVALQVLVTPLVRDAVAELARQYTAAHPTVRISVHEADMADTMRRLGEVGGDVMVTAGYTALEVARAARLLDEGDPPPIAWVPLTVTVAGKMADTLTTPAALDADGVRVGIPDPRRDLGAEAAKRLLRRAQLGDRLQQRVIPTGAKRALQDGTIDAWIGYGRLGVGVPLSLPAALREYLPIPAAVTNISHHPKAARAFVMWLASAQSAAAFAAQGAEQSLPKGAPRIVTSLPVRLPAPRRNAGAVVVGQRILLVGGEAGGERLDRLTWVEPRRVLVLDADRRLPQPLEGPAVVHHIKTRRVYVAGGLSAHGPTQEILRFDPKDGALDRLAIQLPLPMTASASSLSRDTWFICGGRGTAGVLLADCARIEIGSGEVYRLPEALPSPRAGMAAALAPDHQIWLFGGETSQGPTEEILSLAVQTGRVTRIAPVLPAPMTGLSVLPWPGGFLLVGGRTYRGPRDSTTVLKPDGRQLRQSERLPYPVSDAAAVRFGRKAWIFGGLSHDRVERRILRFPY